MPRNPTPAQAAAARRNGQKGGRKAKPKPEPVPTGPDFDLTRALKRERERNFQFLVDLRDGLLPSSTLADRLRAAENLLDRDPETARARGEYDVAVPAGEAPKLFELGELDLSDEKMQQPPGWREEPVGDEAAVHVESRGSGAHGNGDGATDDGRAHPNGEAGANGYTPHPAS